MAGQARGRLLGHHDGRNWRDTTTGEIIYMITYPDAYVLTTTNAKVKR